MFRRTSANLSVYAILLAVAALAIWFIRAAGMPLEAPPPTAGVAHFGRAGDLSASGATFHVLLALIAILAASRVLGAAFARLHQPQVMGEMLAGILIGPSLLGRVAPQFSAFLLPPEIAPALGMIAQIGVVLFMFLVGLEFDTGGIRKRAQAAFAISQASVIIPFVLGMALALYLYPRFSTSDVPFFVFALFIGISMSVTAFPVLARILMDRKLHKTRLGTIALTCASMGDATAWCLLAIVVSVANPTAGGALQTTVLTGAFAGGMLFVGRPLIRHWAATLPQGEPISHASMGVVFIGLLAAAWTTEAIGIHALFGAFLIGVVIPDDSPLARDLTLRLTDAVVVLFLPVFFAFTGLRMQIGLVSGLEAWLVCGLIIVVATLGKFGGSYAAARFVGLAPRDSAAVGVLMNTRGLMELIVLNLGLDLGVISASLFAMFVLMALLTTFATAPALYVLYRGRRVEEEFAAL